MLLAGAAGAAVFALVDIALDLHPRVAGAVTSGTWVASTRFPSLAYVAGTAAAALVGKPWLSRPWKRAADLALLTLIGAMAVAGSAGVSELVLAGAAGASVGALVLVVVGSPNRRPAPSDIVGALAAAGLEIRDLRLERAEGGRAQLYRADTGTAMRSSRSTHKTVGTQTCCTAATAHCSCGVPTTTGRPFRSSTKSSTKP